MTQLSRRLATSLLLLIGLASLYTITYSGYLEIADQLQYYDAVGNLTRVGEPDLTLSMWQFMPESFPRPPRSILRETIAEPGLILAAAPLYWLADKLEGVGLAHTTYLFNVIVCAVVCVVMFWYALLLGYKERIALFGAVCLGIGTILFPYSQKLFREPLMMIWLMLAALTLEASCRHITRIRVAGWLLAALLLIAALYTKGAAILALPGLLVMVLPDVLWQRRSIQRLSDGLLLLVLIVTVLIAYTDLLGVIFPPNQVDRLPLFAQFAIEPEYSRTALHTYLFSLGGSILGTSPILLLALPGGWLLLRKGERRQVWSGMLVALGFAYGYALLRGEEWFGGTIWPQRFLLPTLPFMLVLILPILERVIGNGYAAAHPYDSRPKLDSVRLQFLQSRRLQGGVFLLLALYSLWWQAAAVSFDWNVYSRATFDLSFGGLAYWGPGFNAVQYIRPVVLSGLWGSTPLIFAWVRMGIWWIPLAFGGLMLVCAALGWHTARHISAEVNPRREAYVGVPLLVILFPILIYLMLRAIYIDPLYQGENTALHAMVTQIRETVPLDEPVILSEREYNAFFLNYGKVGSRRVIGLPFHPGDRASCEQALTVESDNPEILLAPYSAPVLHALAERSARLWILASSGPEIPCVVRPVERFMGQRYYRITETRTAPQVRLIQYQTTDAPDPYAFRGADTQVDLTYTADNGETLNLIGMTLPKGETYAAGDWLPLSLMWQSEMSLTRVYTVAWFVADAGGVKAQGEDSWHGATFAPTTLWQPTIPIWDNRALHLPSDLPAGEYQLWVKVYWQDPNTGAINDLKVSGSTVVDAVIGMLPVRIHINP